MIYFLNVSYKILLVIKSELNNKLNNKQFSKIWNEILCKRMGKKKLTER